MDDEQVKDSTLRRTALDSETGEPLMEIDRDENVNKPDDNDNVNSGNIIDIPVEPDDTATENKEAILEIVSETVKPVQQAKKKMKLQMSLDDSSDKPESGESSGSAYAVEDDAYSNRNDDDKDHMDEDHNKDSTSQKAIHDSGTSAPLEDVDCYKTCSISGDSSNSGDIAEVHSNLDDSKTENKGTEPKTSTSDKDNIEAPTELLTKRISRQVRRFFQSHPVVEEVKEASPLERRRRIITSSFFTDEFARDNDLTSPTMTDDKVPEGFEQRLYEMMASSKRLKDTASSDKRLQSSPNLLRKDIEASRDKASTNPAFSETTRRSARSAASTSDPSKSSSTGHRSSDLRGEQRQTLKLEESTGGSREKRTEEAVHLETARQQLQALHVSEEEYVWHFPVIRQKYIDGDQPGQESDGFMDPVIEDKIASIMYDMGKTVMAMLYDDLADKLQRRSQTSPSVRGGEERIKVGQVKVLNKQKGILKVPRSVKDPRTSSPDRHDATKTQLRLPSWAPTKPASSPKSCRIFIRNSNIPPEIKIRYGLPTTHTSSRDSGISPLDPGCREEGNDSVLTPNVLNIWKLRREQDNKPSTSSGGERSRHGDSTIDSIPAIPHETIIPEEKQVALVSHGDISESKEPCVVPRDDKKMEKMTGGAMGTSKDLQQEGKDAKTEIELLQARSSSEDSGGRQDLKESKASDSCESPRSEEVVLEKEQVKRKDPLDKDSSRGKDAKRRHLN